MAFTRPQDTHSGGARGAAALAACVLALGLGGWRASVLLAAPAQAPAGLSAAEHSLLEIVAPIAGPGMARVSIARNGDGGQTVLVLLDAAVRDVRPQLERIIPIAAGLSVGGADTVIIEETAFARGLPGRPGTLAWAELSALTLIAGLCAFLAISRREPGRVSHPSVVADTTVAVQRAPEPLRPVRVVPAPVEAGDIVRRDPATAAAVVRAWIGAREETP